MADIRTVLKDKPFRFSKTATDFLHQTLDDVNIDPVLLVDTPTNATYKTLSEIPNDLLSSVRGVSFFAAIKALEEKEDVGNAEWFLNRLRIPGKFEGANPDTQRIVLALLHGLHAYFASKSKDAPVLGSPLPTRFQYAIQKYEADSTLVIPIQTILTKLIKHYLNNTNEEIVGSVSEFIREMKNPVDFLKNNFFKVKTGKSIPVERERVFDTATVRDFYVQRIPLIHEVLTR